MTTKDYRKVKKTIKAYAAFLALYNDYPEAVDRVADSLEHMDAYAHNRAKAVDWTYAFFMLPAITARVVYKENRYNLFFIKTPIQ